MELTTPATTSPTTTSINLDDPALVKLKNVLGSETATTLVREVFAELGVDRLAGADDQLRFGEELVKRGGLLEAIGRSIKVRALLHGAGAR